MKLDMIMRIIGAAVLLCGVSMADNGGGRDHAALSTGIVGAMPNQNVAGIPSGAAPWTITEGHAVLTSSGRLNVEVEGLLITAGSLANGSPVPQNLIGTTGPVSMVAGALVCGGVVVGSTPVVALSPAGDAEMEGRISAPQSCMSPIVLVRIAPSVSATTTELGPFIALSGASMSHDDNAGDDRNDRPHHAERHDR